MLRTFVIFLAAGAWLSGCDNSPTKSGGSSSGSGGSASQASAGRNAQGSGTGGATVVNVPRSTKLSDVSSEQLVSLCFSHESEFNDLVDPCTGEGFNESSKSACEAAQAACKNDPSNQGASIDCASANAGDLKDCTVTVGEFEDCLGKIATYIKSLTCANFQSPPSEPACFTTIQSKCQSLFGP